MMDSGRRPSSSYKYGVRICVCVYVNSFKNPRNCSLAKLMKNVSKKLQFSIQTATFPWGEKTAVQLI